MYLPVFKYNLKALRTIGGEGKKVQVGKLTWKNDEYVRTHFLSTYVCRCYVSWHGS
jgi:hypothetical protein